jgi:preprotein translocase subunit SecY
MAKSRSSLVALISNIVLLTLLVLAAVTTLILWLVGDWEQYGWGLGLSLKIVWGVWLVAFVATFLTRATSVGWHHRKARPSEWPAALYKAFSEGGRPPSWFKSGAASFTITVILVSLLGASVLASVLLWIIGNWQAHRGPLELTLKIIWGAWWVLVIITVLVRVGIFEHHRRRAAQAKAARKEEDKQTTTGQPDRGESA